MLQMLSVVCILATEDWAPQLELPMNKLQGSVKSTYYLLIVAESQQLYALEPQQMVKGWEFKVTILQTMG